MKELSTALGREISHQFSIDSLIVADDLYTRRVYSRDLWPRGLVEIREEAEHEAPRVDAVVWPRSLEAVSRVVAWANDRSVELYPYGAGSGVCGGGTPSREQKRPRLVVDLKQMDAIESIDETSLVAKVQAGILGQSLEEHLNQKGFTLGHFPSSIYCSSFGGYLATRAAGQLSTYYGKIEDIVLAIEGVLPSGERFATPVAPRLAVGPDWNHLLMGSEGTLAVLTAGWVKIHRLPEARAFLSYQVRSTAEALDGVRLWMQEGLRPAAVRIYDEDESRMLMGLKEGVKLVSVVEGTASFIEHHERRMKELVASRVGWTDLGEEPAMHWWGHRYDVSYRQQQIMSHRRMILDTFEVSTTWARLPALHKAVKAVAERHSHAGGEFLVILAHFSHFYHCGGNIYFTLCGRSPEGEKTAGYYDRVWSEIMAAALAEGAAVSHHHGIGRLKARAFQQQSGPLYGVLRKFKHELDPKHILNPENLGF